MIQYLLLFVSVCVNAAYSSIHNHLGKKHIHSVADNYRINMWTYGVGAVLLCGVVAAAWPGVSPFTVGLGVAFGLITALSGIFELKAFSCGPMSFTILIITSSMVLPAFSGAVIWNEDISAAKIVGTILMIGSAYFTAVKGNGKASMKWLLFTIAAFLCTGSIGIMQKIQQNSRYASESIPFLTIAFFTASVVCFLLNKVMIRRMGDTSTVHSSGGRIINPHNNVVLCAVLCGVFVTFLNVVNLYLSGVLPSAIMFPVQNGGTTILSVLSAIVIFHEQLNSKRILGLLTGMLALVFLIV